MTSGVIEHDTRVATSRAGKTPLRLRPGDLVRVKPLTDILATLDDRGTLHGLPFMPEMVAYCGRTFPVARRVGHVYLDFYYYVGQLDDTVALGDLRCSGRFHDGCQMACPLLWKEAWLQPAEAELSDAGHAAAHREGLPPPLRTEEEGKFFCQATQFVAATKRLPWWDVRQYARQLRHGQTTLGQLLRMLWLLACNRVRQRLGRAPSGLLRGPHDATPAERLQLQPGEWVEVKSREEIAATLDGHGKNRGLAFVPEMGLFAGRQFRVARRVDRMIVEGTGQMRDLRNTVALEHVTCCGLAQRRCPRGCFHLWREIWLRRVVPAADDDGGGGTAARGTAACGTRSPDTALS